MILKQMKYQYKKHKINKEIDEYLKKVRTKGKS